MSNKSRSDSQTGDGFCFGSDKKKVMLCAFFLIVGILLGTDVNSILLSSYESMPHWVLLRATDFWLTFDFIYYGLVPLLLMISWLNWW